MIISQFIKILDAVVTLVWNLLNLFLFRGEKILDFFKFVFRQGIVNFFRLGLWGLSLCGFGLLFKRIKSFFGSSVLFNQRVMLFSCLVFLGLLGWNFLLKISFLIIRLRYLILQGSYFRFHLFKFSEFSINFAFNWRSFFLIFQNFCWMFHFRIDILFTVNIKIFNLALNSLNSFLVLSLHMSHLGLQFLSCFVINCRLLIC